MNETINQTTAVTRRFLIFSVGSEFYGTGIIKVREIIRYESITPVHDTFSYIKGVINLRGKIIPIMDLRSKFGLNEKEYNDKTVFIMLEIQGENGLFQMGVAVDAVHEVISITEQQIEETPRMGMSDKAGYLEGIVQTEGRMVMLLDMDRILGTSEIIDIAGLGK